MRFGVAVADITPELPVSLGGFGYDLDRRASHIDLPLTVTSLAMRDSNGNTAVLCGLDAVAIDEQTTDAVSKSVSRANGGVDIPIMLVASHTHSAPNIVDGLLGVGKIERSYLEKILAPKLAASIIRAINNLADGQLSVRQINADGFAYDRTRPSPISSTITGFELVNSQGTSLSGAHFACHPVLHGKNSKQICPDFPGYTRKHLAESTDRQTAGLWLPGCGAEVNPCHILIGRPITEENIEAFGTQIAVQAMSGELVETGDEGVMRTANTHVDLPVRNGYRFDISQEIENFMRVRGSRLGPNPNLKPLIAWFEQVRPVLDSFDRSSISVPVSVIALGSIVFLGFGGEVQSRTSQELSRRFPNHTLITTMTTNGYEGYLPETSDYEHAAFQTGRPPLVDGAGDILVDKTADFLESVI